MSRVRQHLGAYGDARRTVTMLQGQLKCMEAAADTPPELIRDTKNRLTLATAQSAQALKLTQELINAVPDSLNIRELLNMRYVQCLRWDDVADCMYLDRRWVLRLHKRALDYLETHPTT